MDVLAQGDERYVLFPIKHPDIWEMYKKHEAAFWTASEVDLEVDRTQFDELSENEQHFIKHVLAFFAASDGIVCENLACRFFDEVQIPEARSFYSFQMAMESIHSETYSLLIDTLIKDNTEKHKLFHAIKNIPSIGAKADWCKKYIESAESFAMRLIAFACVEGIFFSGSFCSIYWLKKRGLMPGLTFSNELISRDEGLHTDFACLLYEKIGRPLDIATTCQIVQDAVELEKLFIISALPCSLIGMNCEMMTEYIKFVADRLLQSLGAPKVYNASNPFPWMDMISLQGKTNFFEKRVGEYQKANVLAKKTEDKSFSTMEDF
ncbi:MAG: ribonucleoside-diphosphate reductase [Methanobacteriota archaeon]|nr:MAG: ribonucleoside-diphosphate reductase [Euryarchaeota archaeon]|tara:strand:- start:13060 stop:14022 length:963 start_codon:yes stop_codon:yes gene_type:complete